MRIRELQDEIIRLKNEKDICILAHSYQAREITEIADFTGDSFGLSVEASKAPQKAVIMCGVRFMAETVKILSPEKRVFLANPLAGCPMAEQLDKEMTKALREKFPDYTVVCYVNTTADTKTLCDVCVTSSSAVKIIGKLENRNILFIPDKSLGTYVASQLPDKNIKLFQGGCPTHLRANKLSVDAARSTHPGAKLLVHPECLPEVVKSADFVGSTTAIMDYAIKSDANEFIIGTENSILEHLQYECPHKSFYPLSNDLVCHNMKVTTLADVYNCLNGNGGEEIQLDADTMSKAKRCIDCMIELG